MQVRLVEIDKNTLEEVLKLRVSPHQEKYVADNATSIAQASYETKSWLRGIYAGEEAVGLVLLYLDESKPEFSLWRLMISSEFQGKGFGKAALLKVIDFIRSLNKVDELFVSCVPGEFSPVKFYEKIGFTNTGKIIEGEHLYLLKL